MTGAGPLAYALAGSITGAEIDMTECMLVLCTCPDQATAKVIATAILEERLAACVNRVPGIQSLYRWQGHIEEDEEVLLLIKTTAECFERLEKAISKRHPAELPEIVGVCLSNGSKDYLDWIRSCTGYVE